MPKWLKAIPEGSHGSGTYQKRLWKVVSDYVRIRDWYTFGPACIATGKHIAHWKDGQAGHFKPYSKCHGMLKFSPRNIHLQGAQSNGWGDYDDWKQFEASIQVRYGMGHIHAFEQDNRRNMGQKMYDSEVLTEIQNILELMKDLPEQPEYYQRVMTLLHEEKERIRTE